jgi:hypothetical protein
MHINNGVEAAKHGSSPSFLSKSSAKIVTVLHGIVPVPDVSNPAVLDQSAALFLCMQGVVATLIAMEHTKHIIVHHVHSRLSLALLTAAFAAAISLLPALLALKRTGRPPASP